MPDCDGTGWRAPHWTKQAILETGGVVMTASEANHRPVSSSVAYRFDYGGHSLVITGDIVYYPPLVEAVRGVDL